MILKKNFMQPFQNRVGIFSSSLLLAVVILFVFWICIFLEQKFVISKENEKLTQLEKTKISSSEAKKIITNRANDVIFALKTKDMKKLSAFIHPNKGVRFSPYAFVDFKNDLIFTSTQLKNLLTNTNKYIWGYDDATGDPIELTFSEYFKRFIYDQDFANAKEIGYQRIIGRGNTVNNNFEAYPKAIIVEYHFPGFNPAYSGMDWVSLRLVFEKKDKLWYLVGVIHDQWTS